MFLRRQDFVTREVYYEDSIDGTQYHRAVCALAWPWHPTPGCVLVLGERRNRLTRLGAIPHVDVKAETISDVTYELIDAADRNMQSFCVPFVITLSDDERVAYIDHENDQRRMRHASPIRIQHPLSWSGKGEGILPYYIGLLRHRIVNDKTLHFSQHSQLPMDIRPILGKEMALSVTSSVIQYPSLCALCWCLDDIDSKQDRGSIDYDRILSGSKSKIGGY